MNIFASAPDTPGLKIRWGDGWIEDFPEDEFAEECRVRPRKIFMYHKGQEPCLVEYSLTVHGAEAFLNYGGRFREVNVAPDRDLYIGVTRIRFTDTSRIEVQVVMWKDEGKSKFTDYDIRASWVAIKTPPPFRPPNDDQRLRGLLTSVLRPGQLRFRHTLLSVYGCRCCISGTIIEEALPSC